MGLTCSNLKWDVKTQKHPEDTRHGNAQDGLSILQVGRRRGDRLRESLCVARKRKSGSFRLALSGNAAKTDARDACGVQGNDKGGSQLLSL